MCDKPSQPTWYRPRCGRASLSGEARLGCEVQNEWAGIPHHSPEIRNQCKSRVLGYSMAAVGAMGPWHLMSRLQYGCIDAPVKMITHCASRRKTYGAVGACKGNVCGRADVAKAHQSKWAGTEGGGRLPTSPPPSHLLHTDSNPIENTGTMNAPCSKDAWAVSSQPSPLPFGDSQGCGE